MIFGQNGEDLWILRRFRREAQISVGTSVFQGNGLIRCDSNRVPTRSIVVQRHQVGNVAEAGPILDAAR